MKVNRRGSPFCCDLGEAMGRKEYESRTEELLKPIVDSLGLRIYDVE